MTWLLHRLKGDKLIWLVIFLISMMSLLAVYTGAGSPMLRARAGTEYYLIKHGLLLLAGFGIMYMVSRFNYRIFARISDYLLYLSIPVLVYTLLAGEDINDASRWIRIFGQSFQPSDFAKVALIIHLAKILTQKQDVINDFREGFLKTIIWVVAICGLIAIADLSTAALLFMTSLVVLFIAGIGLKHIGGFILIGMLAFLVVSKISGRLGTWQSRWDDYYASWTDPDYDPGYQVKQAYGAMAGGGVFGKGPGKSTQRNYVPNSTSDMIYPIIIEEHGFIGALLVIIFYLFLLFRTVGIVTMSKTFGALLAAGLCFLLVLQALANMAVAVGVLPVTGLPLPMLSMGGTSILFSAFSLGIILSVSRHALEEKNEGGDE